MTEDEAKTKWCPFARVATHQHAAVGNMGVFDDNETYAPLGHCIGSKCMAWRWLFAERNDLTGQPVETWPDLTPFHRPGVNLTRHGCCGLAGKP